MKKLFTLIAAALFAVGANATEEQLLVNIDSYPWNYELASFSSEVSITFDQWGTFTLIGTDNAITVSDYKGYKLEFADASDVQVAVKSASDADLHYADLPSDATTITNDFNENILGETTISNFGIQGKENGAKVTIKRFVLIKADGTEEDFAYSLKQNGWHVSVALAGAGLSFTGQWGGVKFVKADGTDAGFKQGDKSQTWTIEFAEPLPVDFLIDRTNADGLDAKAGETKVEFTISDETAIKSTYDGEELKSQEKVDVPNVYFKAKADAGYPYVVKIKSVKCVIADTDGIQTIKAAGAQDGAIYNLAGQKVNESYKGIVIKNGRKYVQK